MKRITCKLLIGVGVAWLIIMFLTVLVTVVLGVLSGRIAENLIGVPLLILVSFLISGFPGIILIIIGVAKWNSEKETKRKRRRV